MTPYLHTLLWILGVWIIGTVGDFESPGPGVVSYNYFAKYNEPVSKSKRSTSSRKHGRGESFMSEFAREGSTKFTNLKTKCSDEDGKCMSFPACETTANIYKGYCKTDYSEVCCVPRQTVCDAHEGICTDDPEACEAAGAIMGQKYQIQFKTWLSCNSTHTCCRPLPKDKSKGMSTFTDMFQTIEEVTPPPSRAKPKRTPVPAPTPSRASSPTSTLREIANRDAQTPTLQMEMYEDYDAEEGDTQGTGDEEEIMAMLTEHPSMTLEQAMRAVRGSPPVGAQRGRMQRGRRLGMGAGMARMSPEAMLAANPALAVQLAQQAGLPAVNPAVLAAAAQQAQMASVRRRGLPRPQVRKILAQRRLQAARQAVASRQAQLMEMAAAQQVQLAAEERAQLAAEQQAHMALVQQARMEAAERAHMAQRAQLAAAQQAQMDAANQAQAAQYQPQGNVVSYHEAPNHFGNAVTNEIHRRMYEAGMTNGPFARQLPKSANFEVNGIYQQKHPFNSQSGYPKQGNQAFQTYTSREHGEVNIPVAKQPAVEDKFGFKDNEDFLKEAYQNYNNFNKRTTKRVVTENLSYLDGNNNEYGQSPQMAYGVQYPQ